VLQPDDPRIAGPVTLRGPIPNAAEGVAVVAEITRYPDVPDGPIEAAVLKVLGDPDDPRTEVEKVLACADVEEQFPDEVTRIADGTPTEVRDVDSSPTLAADGTIFVGSDDRKLYALRAQSGAPSAPK
jgi:ribonuclease R